MKKTLFLILFALLLSAVPAVAQETETIENYTLSFGGLDTTNRKFAPRGWTHYLYSDWYETTYVSHEDGGFEGGAWLESGLPASTWSHHYDCFITPKVSGKVTLLVKKISASGFLEFFKSPDGINLGGSYYAPDEYTGTVEGYDEIEVGEWGIVTLPDVPEGSYIAFAPSYLGIQEFTAEKCELTYRKNLKMTVSKASSDNVVETADHKMTLKVNIELANGGDFDIEANTVKISIKNTNTGLDFGEFTVEEAIPMGTVVTLAKEITGDCIYGEGTVNNPFEFTESYTGTSQSVWFTYTPFAPIYNFTFNVRESGVTGKTLDDNQRISEGISFGISETGAAKTFYIYNSGSDVLNVTNVTVTEGFTLSTPATFTVAAGGNEPVGITFSAGEGFTTGKLTIETEKLGSFEYTLQGLVPAATAWRESFEGEQLPAGFVFGTYWSLSKTDAGMATEGNEQWVTTSTASDFITPLIKTGEGDALYIYANKSDNTSGNMEVLVSTDRLEWTSVYKVGARAGLTGIDDFFSSDPVSPDCYGYSKYAWRIYEVPLPAGDCYVQIKGAGIRVNDLVASALVEVEHDILFVSDGSPEKAMVNNPYRPSVTFRNVNAADETDYTVSLVVNGEKYAATECPEFEAGSVMTFNFSYTPHEAGAATIWYEFAKGDFAYLTPEKEITIEEEVATREVQVGQELITSDGPIYLYYKNSMSQIIYKGERLGFSAGSNITGLSYIGSAAKTMTGTLTVYMQNTDDEEYEIDPENTGGWADYYLAEDVENMTLVYQGQYTVNQCGNYSSQLEPMLPITLDTPFTYTGSNLRIHMLFCQTDYCSNYWSFDNSDNPNGKQFIKFYTDSDLDDLDLVYRWGLNSYGFPVTIFTVEKEVALVNGTVTDSKTGSAIGNAEVSFVSGDVIYNATTNEAGEYEVTVFQSDLSYDATVEAENYDAYNESGIEFVAGEEANVKDFVLVESIRDGIKKLELEGQAYKVYTVSGIEVAENTFDTLPAAVYIVKKADGTAFKVAIK